MLNYGTIIPEFRRNAVHSEMDKEVRGEPLHQAGFLLPVMFPAKLSWQDAQ